MNKYKYLYLFWLLPATFLFMTLHQSLVYWSITDTYKNGKSYTAEATDFHFKQVGAQTSGYLILHFKKSDGKEIRQRLSIPVEMAPKLREIRVIPIRYQPGAFEDIVMMPTFGIQKELVWMNMLIAFAGFVITFLIALTAHRFANNKLLNGEEEMVIERID